MLIKTAGLCLAGGKDTNKNEKKTVCQKNIYHGLGVGLLFLLLAIYSRKYFVTGIVAIHVPNAYFLSSTVFSRIILLPLHPL